MKKVLFFTIAIFALALYFEFNASPTKTFIVQKERSVDIKPQTSAPAKMESSTPLSKNKKLDKPDEEIIEISQACYDGVENLKRSSVETYTEEIHSKDNILKRCQKEIAKKFNHKEVFIKDLFTICYKNEFVNAVGTINNFLDTIEFKNKESKKEKIFNKKGIEDRLQIWCQDEYLNNFESTSLYILNNLKNIKDIKFNYLQKFSKNFLNIDSLNNASPKTKSFIIKVSSFLLPKMDRFINYAIIYDINKRLDKGELSHSQDPRDFYIEEESKDSTL